VNLQQISLDCVASDQQCSVPGPSQAQALHVESLPAYSKAASCAGWHQPVVWTTKTESLGSIRDRMLFSSHPSLSLADSSYRPLSTAGPSAVVGTGQHRTMPIQTASQPSTMRGPATTSTMQPATFAAPSSSLFTNRLQSLPVRPSVTAQRSLSSEHPSSAINRLREKIGRGWLPPEPPYPPPPDDVPPSPGTSSAALSSPPQQNRTFVSQLPVVDAVKTRPGEEPDLYAEPPLVDSTTEVTTTTDGAEDGTSQLYLPKRPIEREDGEISDDEPDSVGADLPPDSSGISSSNSRWNQPGSQSFRGFRGGSGVMVYRPRFPFRGHFLPRGRGFFRGRGFAPWRQWYDGPIQHRARDWAAHDDEHIVDSSGVLSPQTEKPRTQSTSSRSPLHSPISSSSDSEQEESSRHSRSDRHSTSSSRHSKHKLKSKHVDHPVADSTRTLALASPDVEQSSDSDKELSSHSLASKKKVCCFSQS